MNLNCLCEERSDAAISKHLILKRKIASLRSHARNDDGFVAGFEGVRCG